MNKNKKTNITDSKKQEQYLPETEKAECKIKRLILLALLLLLPRFILIIQVQQVIDEYTLKLPKWVINREDYIKSLQLLGQSLIHNFYDKEKAKFEKAKKKIDSKVIKPITTPKEVFTIDTKYQAKGTPYIEDYAKKLKQRIKDMADQKATTNGISNWQKAELDIRHEHQQQMIDNLVKNGVKYAWTSSHPDCSKRCEPWQGKLFDLQSDKSELSNHRMRKKIDGHTVYCFKEIVEKVDKYGYHNNIIVGFNCRHRLVPYTKNSTIPNDYSKEQVEKNRKINAKLREMERAIRKLKQEIELIKEVDIKQAQMLNKRRKELIEQYKAYAEKNGYAWYEYRIKV